MGYSLVYCTKCGKENPDDAVNCSNCGAAINPQPYRQTRRYSQDDICFGGRSGTTWTIIIGVFILMIGVASLLGDVYPWLSWDKLWPLFLIVLALLIIVNAMQKR